MDCVEYRKSVPVRAEYDVLVCGGGPAGFCAAVQAARAGARVAIVEQAGQLGGTITTGGNPQIALFYAEGRQIIAGIGWELVTRLAAEGWARIPDFSHYEDHSVLGVDVNAVMAAHLMDVLCAEAGVDLYLLQPLVDALAAGGEGARRVEGALIATKTGPQLLKAGVFVDCTGDGDLSAFAGAAFELGDRDTGELQPGTLRYYLSGFRPEDIDREQADDAFRSARARGELTRNEYWPAHGSPSDLFRHDGNNINHITGVNGADSDSRTRAQVEGRASVARTVRWARRHVRGAGDIEAIACAPEVGIRESRRVLCDRYITRDEYLRAVVYDDAVSYTYYPVDLHTSDEHALVNTFLSGGRVPTIPYGALTVRGFENLLVAGRCISGDRLANSAFRVKSSCMAMGQAAGAAAALAVRGGTTVRGVDIDALRALLRAHGAIVPKGR